MTFQFYYPPSRQTRQRESNVTLSSQTNEQRPVSTQGVATQPFQGANKRKRPDLRSASTERMQHEVSVLRNRLPRSRK